MDQIVVTNPNLFTSAITTLSREPKALESKWFYDTRGSELFEEITAQPEYYPTRKEVAILRNHAQQFAALLPQGGALVELGSGASVKTRILLDALPELNAYVPLDISGPFLNTIAATIRSDYPSLAVTPQVADFMVALPAPPETLDLDKIVFFPGSTIGNLMPSDAISLLARIRKVPKVKALILGADLVKNEDVLINADDDQSGITAAFNLNILQRLNQEIGATFDLNAFEHEARWNKEHDRIEMHLVSTRAQSIQIGTHRFDFQAGESIHTENSHKYSQEKLTWMAKSAGWELSDLITDAEGYFSVTVLTPH